MSNTSHQQVAPAPAQPDFIIDDHGSIALLFPQTDAARDWVAENLPDDVQYFGTGVVVEHRYIGDIAFGIHNDGLVVR